MEDGGDGCEVMWIRVDAAAKARKEVVDGSVGIGQRIEREMRMSFRGRGEERKQCSQGN